jgi:hypothetical protein
MRKPALAAGIIVFLFFILSPASEKRFLLLNLNSPLLAARDEFK